LGLDLQALASGRAYGTAGTIIRFRISNSSRDAPDRAPAAPGDIDNGSAPKLHSSREMQHDCAAYRHGLSPK
jgi:hypothetical protein